MRKKKLITVSIHTHIQRLFHFQLSQKLQYADIVGKIRIYDDTNRDFRVIGLLI